MPPLIQLLKNDVVWKDNRIVPKYSIIIRDIINLFAEWADDDPDCFLDIQHINIIEDRVDETLMLNSGDQNTMRTCKAQFRVLVTKILKSENRRSTELTHFYNMASRDKVTFHNLWYHPLLLESQERYNFPKRACSILECHSNWIEEYKSYEKNKYIGERKRNISIRNTIQSSKHRIVFTSIYEHDEDSYEDNVVGVLNYTIKVINHYGQHLTKTYHNSLEPHEVEEALTELFPERLTDLYEFLVVHKNIVVGKFDK